MAIYAGRPFPPPSRPCPRPSYINYMQIEKEKKRKKKRREAKVRRSCILHTLSRGGLKSFLTLRRWSVFVLAPAENATRFFSWALLNQEDCWIVSQLAPGFFLLSFLGKRVSWWWCNLQCAQWSCFAKKKDFSDLVHRCVFLSALTKNTKGRNLICHSTKLRRGQNGVDTKRGFPFVSDFFFATGDFFSLVSPELVGRGKALPYFYFTARNSTMFQFAALVYFED